MVSGLGIDVNEESAFCEPCARGKVTDYLFYSLQEEQRIHSRSSTVVYVGRLVPDYSVVLNILLHP